MSCWVSDPIKRALGRLRVTFSALSSRRMCSCASFSLSRRHWPCCAQAYAVQSPVPPTGWGQHAHWFLQYPELPLKPTAEMWSFGGPKAALSGIICQSRQSPHINANWMHRFHGMCEKLSSVKCRRLFVKWRARCPVVDCSCCSWRRFCGRLPAMDWAAAPASSTWPTSTSAGLAASGTRSSAPSTSWSWWPAASAWRSRRSALVSWRCTSAREAACRAFSLSVRARPRLARRTPACCSTALAVVYPSSSASTCRVPGTTRCCAPTTRATPCSTPAPTFTCSTRIWCGCWHARRKSASNCAPTFIRS